MQMARKSLIRPYQVGAVLTRGSYILGMGRNRPIEHYERLLSYKTVHAELDALGKARGQADAIYVVVLNGEKIHSKSRPCELCRLFLKGLEVHWICDGEEIIEYIR
jgi:deoxycytidylate deaminase